VTPEELSPPAQDCLKAIWRAEEWRTGPATTSSLAASLGVAASTVSEMVRRLGSQGLVLHEPYAPVELSDAGRAVALAVVRRHRLIESYLVERLGYTWDEVHDEAEVLEHAVSDRLVERIDAALGRPTHDPHGDPIPTADGRLPQASLTLLGDVDQGAAARIARISDSDPELLRYLTANGVAIGARVRLLERQPATGVVRLGLAEDRDDLFLGEPAQRAIWLELDSSGAGK
jgi:DtxR family transcriptional regulator, Mn-dependent transcriptional regulator